MDGSLTFPLKQEKAEGMSIAGTSPGSRSHPGVTLLDRAEGFSDTVWVHVSWPWLSQHCLADSVAKMMARLQV